MSIETQNADNALARRLAQGGLLDAAVLGRCLAEAQSMREAGQVISLASLLVQRGLVDPRALQPGETKDAPVEREPTRPGLLNAITRSRHSAGSQVGGYTIERELGRGGMGAVYQGRDPHGTPVAIKVMLNPRKGAKQKERFRRECAALAALDHPGIVKLLHADTEEDLPSMVLEFVEGRDLQKAYADGDLSLEQRLHVLETVCRAVHHAHEQGILHRDLKPANVLLTADGQPKVTDFGLARDVSRHTRLTKTGATMGTPGYMAPEQVQGKKEMDHRGDVFALGVMLYEAVTGDMPFAGDSPIMILAQIVRAEPDPPTKHAPDLDPRLDEICAKAMAKAPEDRYGSALELAEAIAGLRESEGSLAILWRRARPVLAVLAVLAGVAGAAVAWRARPQGPLSPEEARAQAADLHSRAWDLLTAESSLVADREAVAGLRAELEALRRRAPEPELVDKAHRRVNALAGLTALATGDDAASDALHAELNEAAPAPEVRALRGAWAVAREQGDMREAAQALTSGLARGMRRPELHAWRALALARSGLATAADAEQVLNDLAAAEEHAPALVDARARGARVRAHLTLGQLDAARAELAKLDPQPTDLRWSLALADAERRIDAEPAQVLEALSALPPQTPPDPRREAMADRAYRPAELRFVGDGAARELSDADRERILNLLRLARLLWPEKPVPPRLVDVLFERSLGGAGSQGDPELAAPFSDLVPGDLRVQRGVGQLAQRVSFQEQKRACLRALRRAISLEENPALRMEDQRALVSVLAYVNNRFENEFERDECEELLEVSSALLERFDASRMEYAEILAARAVALRRLGEVRAAWRDVNDAVERNGAVSSFRYTRMRLALALDKRDVAFEDAVYYANVGDSSQRNRAAVVVAWEEGTARGRLDLVRGPLIQLLKNNTELAGWWVRLAHVHAKTGDPEAAARCVDRAVQACRSRRELTYDDPELLQQLEATAAAYAGEGDPAPLLDAALRGLEERREASAFLP